MSRIHGNLERREFTVPPSVEQKTVCSISGMLAVPGSCPGITELFATDILPTERCTGHGYSYDEEDTSETEEDEEGETPEVPIDPITPSTPDPGPSTSPDDSNSSTSPEPPTPPEPPDPAPQ